MKLLKHLRLRDVILGFSPVAGILLVETLRDSEVLGTRYNVRFSPVAGILLVETKGQPTRQSLLTWFQSRCRDSVS